MTEDGQQAQAAYVADLYRAIGQFIVDFEQVTLRLHFIGNQILIQKGLKDSDVAQLLFANLAADATMQLVWSLISHTQKLKEKERKLVSKGFNRFKSLTERRNDIAHSQHFVVLQKPEGIPEARSFKAYRSSSGGRGKRGKLTSHLLGKYSREAIILGQFFVTLGECISETWSIEEKCTPLLANEPDIPDLYHPSNEPPPVGQ